MIARPGGREKKTERPGLRSEGWALERGVGVWDVGAPLFLCLNRKPISFKKKEIWKEDPRQAFQTYSGNQIITGPCSPVPRRGGLQDPALPRGPRPWDLLGATGEGEAEGAGWGCRLGGGRAHCLPGHQSPATEGERQRREWESTKERGMKW